MADITTKKATLLATLDGVVTELHVKTAGDNVYIDDDTTVSAKMSEMVTAINLRAKKSEITEQVKTEVDAAVSQKSAVQIVIWEDDD